MTGICFDDVMVVGLTGQSGSGKTTVCKIFMQGGYAIINADTIARNVMEKGKSCLEEVFECFGSDVINSDGSLNRKALAEIVFSDKLKLEMLNSICHPYITEDILENIHKYSLSMNGRKIVLLDAPTLFESHADDFCDLVISVISDRPSRIKRIMSRDGISAEMAEKRLNSQLDDDFYISHSDFIIRNNQDLDKLSELAGEVTDKINSYYNRKYGKF